MTFRPWRAAALLAPAAIMALTLATPAAAASPSWQLTDQYTSSPACYTTGGGSEYLELNLNGTWSTPVTRSWLRVPVVTRGVLRVPRDRGGRWRGASPPDRRPGKMTAWNV
jgi:hypothetical protein